MASYLIIVVTLKAYPHIKLKKWFTIDQAHSKDAARREAVIGNGLEGILNDSEIQLVLNLTNPRDTF